MFITLILHYNLKEQYNYYYIIFSEALPHQAFTDFKKVLLSKTMRVELQEPTGALRCWVEDMVVLPRCNILIADWGNCSLIVIDAHTGRLISQVRLPDRPDRLCLLPRNRAAVSLPGKKMIQIINVAADQLKLQESVNVEGECGGLAYLNNNFIVGLRDKHCVASINIDGNILKSVSKDNTGKQLFIYQNNICATKEKSPSSIYVSDSGTHTITRLSEELDVLQTFKVPFHGRPGGLTTTGGGQLLVGQWGYRDGNRLWVLDTSTGEYTELSLGLLGTRTVWCSAAYLAFCPRLGRVYVNCGDLRRNNDIQVYEIS